MEELQLVLANNVKKMLQNAKFVPLPKIFSTPRNAGDEDLKHLAKRIRIPERKTTISGN
jgi:hypothetical protein